MAIDTLPRGGGTEIILSETPISITSVVGRVRQGVPFETKITGFRLENGRVILPTYYQTATVEYETAGNEQEFRQFVGKDFANSFFQAQNNISEQTSQVFEDAQFDKINNEGVTLEEFTEAGGIKSLQAFTKIGKSLSKSPMIAMVTENAGDGGLLKSAAQLTAIKKQTGGRGGNGFLNKKVTHASPKAALNSIKTLLPKLQESKLLEKISSLAASPTKVTTSLKPENIPQSKVVKQISQEYKAKLPALNNIGLDLDPLGPFGGIGREKLNMSAQGLAKNAKGVTSLGAIRSKVGGFADGLTDFIKSKGLKVPNFVEEGGSKTNVSKHFNAGSLLADIKPSEKFRIKNRGSGFIGFNTPSTYEFETVDSFEELETEMRNSTRGPKSKDASTAISALIVGWTGPFNGPPEKVNAKSLHEVSKKYDQKFRDNEASSTGISSPLGLDHGIQPHYLILQNGNLQRGRPIDMRRFAKYSKISKTGLKLTFIAGQDAPINEKQFETFDGFIRKWINVFPGGEVFADYELDQNYQGPGFDVKDRITSKYKKEFLVADPSSLEEMPSKEEQNLIRPKNPVRSVTTISKPIDFDKANEDITEKLESKELQRDLDTAINKFGASLGSLNGVSADKLAAKFGAKNLPKGNLKEQLDSKISEASNTLGLEKGTIDSITEKLTKNKTLDLNLAKQLSEKIVL